jgi:hypothetical protein
LGYLCMILKKFLIARLLYIFEIIIFCSNPFLCVRLTSCYIELTVNLLSLSGNIGMCKCTYLYVMNIMQVIRIQVYL